jgi:hypothetical protein
VWRKQEVRITDLEKAHKAFITTQEAEKMMKEIVEPIIADQREVKHNLKDILTVVHEIKTDLAVQSAIMKLQSKQKEE